ncbi:hypothetical protein XA68_11058 [Ophiocordyceps unilateralis]|uniref:Phosphotyrosine protein phosphatase I domain-containing protein n=1 Tax=Ophiocordyceps unilateralis TaxID=268505 RepID=A0A2A9PFX4_OPHUN|nr:hypothetical protein XA68_11058 [Ophiocordyceps unilateralis]
MAEPPLSILFVCLGNICRSTMAEGVFRDLVAKQPEYKKRIGEIDSCGTGAYHAGDAPDSRTMETLEAHGITNYDHSARRITAADFEKFDYIFAMDRSNLSDLERMRRGGTGSRAKVMLFGEFSGAKAETITDPYYGGRDGFQKAYEQCQRFANNFLNEIVGQQP